VAERGKARGLRPLERDAQATIVELAGWRRWSVYHTHDSRHSKSGFPDLALWRDRFVFAELKRVGEKPRIDQVAVLDGLARAGAEVYVWTLDDLHEIGRILERPWRFLPAGVAELHGGIEIAGPRLIDDRVAFAPRSAWIPGQGRRDA
jgi:hypothetical protein